MKSKESMRNVSLHPRENYLRDALGTHRRVPDLEAVIIPREIGKVHPLGLTIELKHNARSIASSVGPLAVQER